MHGHYNTSKTSPGSPPGREEGGLPRTVAMGIERPSVGELLEGFENLEDGMRSYMVKHEMQQVYYEWLSAAATWKTFITLTFKDEKPPDVANAFYRRLVQVLNKRLFGERYVRKVGHSYFNYILGMEFKLSRDVCHFHVLVDQPIDYQLLHSWWGMAAGISWISKVKDRSKALYYVTKYVCKGGDENIEVFLTAKHKLPENLPVWWRDSE